MLLLHDGLGDDLNHILILEKINFREVARGNLEIYLEYMSLADSLRVILCASTPH